MNTNRINGTQWKSLRERVGLTQRDVSDALGYSTPQFISNVERGRCRFPVQKLAKIRKLYRLSVEQVVDLFVSEEKLEISKALKTRGARN